MTRPEDIRDKEYKRIYDKLCELTYPCVIVVYGPERTHRTTYRGEHQGVFSIGVCETVGEAWNHVDCGYIGYPPDLCVYHISGEPVRV